MLNRNPPLLCHIKLDGLFGRSSLESVLRKHSKCCKVATYATAIHFSQPPPHSWENDRF